MLIQFEPKGLRMGLRAADVGPRLILKAGEPRVSEGQEEMDVSAQAEIERVCPSPFCSILVLSELVDDHPCLGGPSALLSLPTLMLISSRNTLTNTTRNSVLPAVWGSLSLAELTM